MKTIDHQIRRAGFILFFFLFFTDHRADASHDNYPAGARAAAMGQVGVMCPDFWSVWHNQAGLGFYPHFAVGFHHENRFVVPEFGLHSVGLTIPAARGTLGLSGHYFGCSAYHESKIGLAFGKAFHERFAVGLQLDYLNTFVNNELGNSGTAAIEAGILAEPVDNLRIGFHVYNPTGSSIPGMGDEKVPVILRAGLGYRFGERLFIGVETEKDLDIVLVRYKLGLEYRLIDYIYARGGVMVQGYAEHSFGIGFEGWGFRASLAFSYQQLVGYTPYFSLHYVFN
jgi:hypothetical protein